MDSSTIRESGPNARGVRPLYLEPGDRVAAPVVIAPEEEPNGGNGGTLIQLVGVVALGWLSRENHEVRPLESCAQLSFGRHGWAGLLSSGEVCRFLSSHGLSDFIRPIDNRGKSSLLQEESTLLFMKRSQK
jgi:hypothetical protein